MYWLQLAISHEWIKPLRAVWFLRCYDGGVIGLVAYPRAIFRLYVGSDSACRAECSTAASCTGYNWGWQMSGLDHCALWGMTDDSELASSGWTSMSASQLWTPSSQIGGTASAFPGSQHGECYRKDTKAGNPTPNPSNFVVAAATGTGMFCAGTNTQKELGGHNTLADCYTTAEKDPEC